MVITNLLILKIVIGFTMAIFVWFLAEAFWRGHRITHGTMNRAYCIDKHQLMARRAVNTLMLLVVLVLMMEFVSPKHGMSLSLKLFFSIHLLSAVISMGALVAIRFRWTGLFSPLWHRFLVYKMVAFAAPVMVVTGVALLLRY